MALYGLIFLMLIARSSAMSVKQVIQNVDREDKIPAEYLVTVKQDVMDDLNLQMDDIIKKIEAYSPKLYIHDIHKFGKTSILVIHSDDEDDAASLNAINEVASVETDVKTKVLDCEEQPVLGTVGLWNLARINQRDPNNDQTYRYKEQDGSGATAYIVDTGVRITHNEFEGRASRGYTAPSVVETEGEDDLHGHGTHCAGTVAGRTFGAAKKAEIIGIKVLDRDGRGPISDAVEGLEWIYNDYLKKTGENGSPYTAVVSMSLGWPRSSALDAAVEELTNIGLLLVASAGNSQTDACSQSPSGAPTSLGVAASDSSDNIAWYSNYGDCADIIAPGSYVLSAGIADDDSSVVNSGTSMATPLVAGVLLRHMSQVGYRSPAQLREWVVDNSTKDVINLRLRDTRNALLYAPCDLQ